MTPAERSTVYRALHKAAERIELRTAVGCCCAISTGNFFYNIRTRKAFKDAMDHPHTREAAELGAYFWPLGEAYKTTRILALLFTAEMVRTGDIYW